MSTAAAQRVHLLRGEDAFAIARATERLAIQLGTADAPLEIWRVDAAEERAAGGPGRMLERISERVSTAPLFGGGTLVAVRNAGLLARDAAGRERLAGLLAGVPEGNGLVLIELTDGRARRGSADPLADAVGAAGGSVEAFPALTRERMEAWLGERARELGTTLPPPAARLLAERVGAYVREGDVDRRHQTDLADQELQKLALLRPGATVRREDVEALVAEAVPGSAWAFLDAVAGRRTGPAAALAERLLEEGTPLPVLVTRLHGRLREILVAREHLARGAREGDLVRLMRLQPYRAKRLGEAAGGWTGAELGAALEGLLELDLLSKGMGPDGQPVPSSDERAGLVLQAWLAQHVARAPSA
ncbi:MAG: DNA polymerase III subunit delta [Candidatus Limnocylindrales bacterium]